MPRRKTYRSALKNEDTVSKLLEDIQSQEILAQLNLECLAGVQTKQTYVQLKNRVGNYLTETMANDWVPDNSFREQVIECSVIALTIERIVAEVVKRKLQANRRLIIMDMLRELFANPRALAKMKVLVDGAISSPQSGFQETTEIVEMICSETNRKRKVLADGRFAKNLDSVSFSNSLESDEENASDVSENGEPENNENYMHVEEEQEVELKPTLDGLHIRSRRERKLNPKYSPSMFQTLYLPNKSNVMTSTPYKEKPSTNGTYSNDSPEVYKKHRNKRKNNEQPQNGHHSESEDEAPQIPPTSVNCLRSVKMENNLPVAVKSAPVFKKKYSLPNKKFVASKGEEDFDESKEKLVEAGWNASVRKSSRQRKVNLKWFSDCDPHRRVNREVRCMMSGQSTPTSNSSRMKEEKAELIAEVERAQKVDRNTENRPSVQSTSQRSAKRHNSSDWHKPRHTTSGERWKIVH